MLALALVLAQEISLTGPLPSAAAPAKAEEKPEVVSVRSKPPPRSASDWEVGTDTIQSVPHETGADVLGTLPGVYVSNRGLLGQAPTLSLRGFQGTSGENMELFVGSVPLNQMSNLRAPGYADMRLVIPEAIRSVRISHGPYDPRQGDFALAGSAHMDLGLDQPGFLGEGTLGSFGTKRVVLAFAPDDDRWGDSFAAFEAYGTDGPGTGRGGDRASFIGQLGYSDDRFAWRSMIAMGTARFDYPGMLSLADLDHGAYPYSAMSPLGRDLTTQAHLGNELFFEMQGGTLTLVIYVSLTKMQIHEDLTGYALDVLAGLPPTSSDDAEQVNQATTYGLNVSYRRVTKLLTKRDILEVGAMTRIDSIDQTDTRLFPDGTINVRNVDAHVDSTSIAGYVDAALYPIPRVVIRGGTRLDSLSYSVANHLGNEGIEQTAQGLHVGNKATVDWASGRGVHWVASYGEGFRSPEALTVSEGQSIPFTTIQSVEAGMRVKDARWQASLAGFASWLSQDLVFDALTRTSMPAPPSQRVGGSAAGTMRQGIFGTSLSATYARAVFTGSDATFQSGEAVPYAPTMVVRDDTFVVTPVGKLEGTEVVGRFGVGLQGAFGATLPAAGGGGQEIPAMYVDALAAASWRSFELSLNGMNLLDRRYYDAEYVYSSNFQKSATLPAPTAHVLVAPPASVFVTLKVRLGGRGQAEIRQFRGE